MDDTTAQTLKVSRSKRGGSGCLFVFCLFFLIIGAAPALLTFPSLQARFTGMEGTVLITSAGSCSWEESDNNGSPTLVNGFYYVYTFTVNSGKVYQITDTSCNNNETVGVREAIWYQPADPTHFLTASQWTFDWLFFLGFSIPMLLFVVGFVRRLFLRLFAPSRRFTEAQRG